MSNLKRGYSFGVAWIAENDEPNTLDAEEVSGYISTLLLADLAGESAEDVASDIVRYRVKNAEGGAQ
ncbi:MAG: hypothetical protein H0U46_03125 [Actinobacteria bacterium]|nr:hypothetical protein [Actinomycetota bacterium]